MRILDKDQLAIVVLGENIVYSESNIKPINTLCEERSET
jgi:hypothetical protein